MHIFYVRHGEAETNLDDTFMDDRESPLTSKGCLQAANVALALRMTRVQFDAVYCSPYKRAQQTCHIITQNLYGKLPKTIITDERLKERDFTGLYGQLIPHDHWMELWDYDSRRAEHDGIELLAEMDARASDFLHELRYTHEKDNPKKPVNILIVAHAGIGLVFRAITEGHPLNGHLFSYPMLDNGEYVELYF